MAKKFSFRVMVLGLILPLAGPMSIRINAVMQTPGGFLHYAVSGIIVGYVAFTIYRTVKALYICVEESESYEPIFLSEQECFLRAKAYFNKFPNDYTIEGYSNCLMYVTPKRYKVPLTYPTKVRACKAFYATMCEHEGLVVKPETLTKLALEGAADFKVDHKGQEMEMGDDIPNQPGDGKAGAADIEAKKKEEQEAEERDKAAIADAGKRAL
jgi:hypothetical protein